MAISCKRFTRLPVSAVFAGAFLAEWRPMREWIGILMLGADLFVLAFKR